MLIRKPFTGDKLINAAVRTVPEIVWAGPHTSADEAEDLPAVTWSTIDAPPEFSYQNLVGVEQAISVHVGAVGFFEAQSLAGDVWAALLNSPGLDLSQVDATQKIIAVRTKDSPVENRTPGQHLNFNEFRFTVYVTVGSAQ
jgi:hypothetical protein